MNVLLFQAICLAGLVSISSRVSGESRSIDPGNREESGFLTHGTIFEISNGQISVLSSNSREPVRYCHGEGTVYVDESGNPIPLRTVKSGVTVTVFYSQTEGQRMANRVIVGELSSNSI